MDTRSEAYIALDDYLVLYLKPRFNFSTSSRSLAPESRVTLTILWREAKMPVPF